MKMIPIYNGSELVAEAKVDDEDYERLIQRRWSLVITANGETRYAHTQAKYRTIKMHRFILHLDHTTPLIHVDHKDLDGLNNQKNNLRECTRSQNGSNRKKYKSGSSQYKGVSWYEPTQRWSARISANGKAYSLGYYKDEVEAAKAYDKAALELCGEFARTNF